MILRTVHIALPDQEAVQPIIDCAKNTFLDITGVTGIEAYPNAEEPGVLLLVKLEGLEAIPTYRDHPVHRAFADAMVKPAGGKITIANYALD